MKSNRRRIVAAILMGFMLSAACAHRADLPLDERLRRAAYFEQQGKPFDAATEYRQILRLTPDNNEARLRLADVLVDVRDYAAAERNYKLALKADPENKAATNNLAWLYAVTGRELAWAYQAVKPLAEASSPHRHAYLDTLGMVCLAMRRYDEAAAALQEASDLCRRGKVMSVSGECDAINRHLAAARAKSGD